MKHKYTYEEFKHLVPNDIGKIKTKAGSWRVTASGNAWLRPYSEYNRTLLCAYIEKKGDVYVGTCMGTKEIFKSPNLESLMCTLDILLMNSNLDVRDPFNPGDV